MGSASAEEGPQLSDDSDRPGAGVGAVLRGARLARDEDLREVAAALRIRLPYLEALEDGRIADLPGVTYGIGFVRAYSDYLGLDTTEIVTRFKDEARGVAAQAQLQFPEPLPGNRVPGGALLLIVLLLAAGVYGGWLYAGSDDRTLVEIAEDVPDRLSGLVSGTESEPSPATTQPTESMGEPSESIDMADASGTQSAPTAEPAAEDGAETEPAPSGSVSSAPEASAIEADSPEPTESAADIPPGSETDAPASGATVPTDNATTSSTAPETALESGVADGSQADATESDGTEIAAPADGAAVETESAPAPSTQAADAESSANADDVVAEDDPQTTDAPDVDIPEAEVPESQSQESEVGEAVTTVAEDAPPEGSQTAATQQAPIEEAPPEQTGAEETGAEETATDETGAEETGTSADRARAEAIETEDLPAPEPETDIADGGEATDSATAGQADAPASDADEAASDSVAAAPEAEPAPMAEPDRIIIQATKESFIQIVAEDGSVVTEKLMLMGEIYRVPPRTGLVLNTGNAGALKLLVNGTLVPPLGEPDEIVRGIPLNAAGLLPG